MTFISIFFFFYPSVVQALMTIFNCLEVNVRSADSLLAVSWKSIALPSPRARLLGACLPVLCRHFY